jgi:ribonuclease BN (tRNA processing enzyme)
VKLTVLGCSGSLPGPDSPASGYLVEADGFHLVIDLGNGALGPLQRFVSPHRVDAVVLSHLHPDHCADMSGLAVALQYGPQRRERPLAVIGPAGTRERIAAIVNPNVNADPKPDSLNALFEFAAPSDRVLGPFSLSFAPVNHPVPTFAVRISDGVRTLVYSADTGECPALVTLARGADVLLCEATWGPDDSYPPNLHLTGAQAGEHAARAGVERLIVTHVPPTGSRDVAAAEARASFGRPVDAARPGSQYEI